MPLPRNSNDLNEQVFSVMREMDCDDPVLAVRMKARQLIGQFETILGDPPFNMRLFSSLRDLVWSDDDPRFSNDSEIAPESDGRVVLRVNKSMPITRQRFSIGHEIGHTLFPEYNTTVRCRKGHSEIWANSDDLLESLCDVAASEFLFPLKRFGDQVRNLDFSASEIARLASEFEASREATVRRLVELHESPLAGVFLSWKNKPVEKSLIERERNQLRLFADDPFNPPDEKLRVDYAIVNAAFRSVFSGLIPPAKSIESEGPIFQASATQSCQDGTCMLDFNTVKGEFRINAMPVYTQENELGSRGGCSVVAILRPVNSLVAKIENEIGGD